MGEGGAGGGGGSRWEVQTSCFLCPLILVPTPFCRLPALCTTFDWTIILCVVVKFFAISPTSRQLGSPASHLHFSPVVPGLHNPCPLPPPWQKGKESGREQMALCRLWLLIVWVCDCKILCNVVLTTWGVMLLTPTFPPFLISPNVAVLPGSHTPCPLLPSTTCLGKKAKRAHGKE